MSSRLTQEAWGPWPALRLASSRVALSLVPALGGRVVSLADLGSGREWLVQGGPLSEAQAREWASEEAVFGGQVSFGWDECLPTVAPCPDPLDAQGAALRDHGDQWGRATESAWHAEAAVLETTWQRSRWRYGFSRRLSFEDPTTIRAEYSLVNASERPMPVLWSIHPVLRLEPGSRLEVRGADSARLTWSNGLGLHSEEVAWPDAARPDGSLVDLSSVRSAEGWAAKLYVHAPGPVRATTPDGSSLDMDWDHEVAPALGIWLSYGGWPPGEPPREQVALEPTTSPDDDLQSALAADRAPVLEPGERLDWWVRLRVGSGPPR